MADPREIELVLHTGDEHIVNAAESALPDTVTKTRVPTTRVLDIVTILLTATAAIKLISALVELRNKWNEQEKTTRIEVRDEKGEVLNLLDASEDAIRQFVEAS